jgi:hypothetical protein
MRSRDVRATTAGLLFSQRRPRVSWPLHSWALSSKGPTSWPLWLSIRTVCWRRRGSSSSLPSRAPPSRSRFEAITQSDLDDVAAELNDRPRQTLGWKTPGQALDEALR